MTEQIADEGMQLLNQEDTVFVLHSANLLLYEKELKEADILIVRAAPAKAIDENIMRMAPKLKVIGRTGVGYDSIDIDAATKLGIPVVITPGANNRSVAEHTLALMFAVSKNIVESQIEVTKGNWKIRDSHKQFELYGKKVGIIGLGRIGRDTAALCKGVGMEIAGYDPFLPKEEIEVLGYEYFNDYEEMLKVCDVISIHVPLNDQTRNMIGKKQLKLMKNTAIIINCARGGIINEKDLMWALEEEEIAGAGLDVFEEEELGPENPLLKTKNITISPHSAAQTKEAAVNMAIMCMEGCQAICRGEEWKYVVNPEVYKQQGWSNKKM